MFTAAIAFPAWLDPVAVSLGPLELRWYSLAYIAGFLLGWRYCVHLIRTAPYAWRGPDERALEQFLTWAIIGTVVGGRLGYVLFYNPSFYLENPLDALKIWEGGMAFHGGLLGVMLAVVILARRHGYSPWAMGDLVAAAAPIGLFFGRLANFVNSELFGRPSDVPWAVIFPTGGGVPRHPSQLYEAVLEGLVLFVVLWLMARSNTVRLRYGLIAGAFWIGYGLFRFLVEFVREPDPQLGFLWLGATMGQLLSLPMILIGLWFVARARHAG